VQMETVERLLLNVVCRDGWRLRGAGRSRCPLSARLVILNAAIAVSFLPIT
jgi:hypothetical protein